MKYSSKYSCLSLEDCLGKLLEDMTNDQALGDIEKNRGTIARQEAEAILDRWQKEWGDVFTDYAKKKWQKEWGEV